MPDSLCVDIITHGPRHIAACQEPCDSISAWHCVHTKPKRERAATDAMQRAGFETCFPQYEMVWRDRQRVIRPLFPCYTFARFDALHDPWQFVVKDRVEREVGTVMTS